MYIDEGSVQILPADITSWTHLHPSHVVPAGIAPVFPLAHTRLGAHTRQPWENSLITSRMTVMAMFSWSESALQAALRNLTPGEIGIQTGTHMGN